MVDSLNFVQTSDFFSETLRKKRMLGKILALCTFRKSDNSFFFTFFTSFLFGKQILWCMLPEIDSLPDRKNAKNCPGKKGFHEISVPEL